MFSDGGWYASNLRVQVRQNFVWTDVTANSLTPTYPYSNQAGSHTTYTFNLPNTWGDGVGSSEHPVELRISRQSVSSA